MSPAAIDTDPPGAAGAALRWAELQLCLACRYVCRGVRERRARNASFAQHRAAGGPIPPLRGKAIITSEPLFV